MSGDRPRVRVVPGSAHSAPQVQLQSEGDTHVPTAVLINWKTLQIGMRVESLIYTLVWTGNRGLVLDNRSPGVRYPNPDWTPATFLARERNAKLVATDLVAEGLAALALPKEDGALPPAVAADAQRPAQSGTALAQCAEGDDSISLAQALAILNSDHRVAASVREIKRLRKGLETETSRANSLQDQLTKAEAALAGSIRDASNLATQLEAAKKAACSYQVDAAQAQTYERFFSTLVTGVELEKSSFLTVVTYCSSVGALLKVLQDLSAKEKVPSSPVAGAPAWSKVAKHVSTGKDDRLRIYWKRKADGELRVRLYYKLNEDDQDRFHRSLRDAS